MPGDTVMVQCRFDLTDSEIAAAARKRAALETEIAKVDSAFNVEREKHKKALGTLEGQTGTLADLIRKGYEMRETECRVEFDYPAALVNTVRADTGEVVKTRPMSDTEKGEGPPLPLGPSILLGEGDPDVQAAKTQETGLAAAVEAEAAGVAPPRGAVEAAAMCIPTGAEAVTDAHREGETEAPSGGGQHVPDDPAGVTEPAGEGAPAIDPATLALLVKGPASDSNVQTAIACASVVELQKAVEDYALSRPMRKAVFHELRLRGIHHPDDGTPLQPPAPVETMPPCQNCGHPESLHGEGRERGCMRQGCGCEDYVHPDPLGITEVEPEAEQHLPEL
jgi:hypothetical protein